MFSLQKALGQEDRFFALLEESAEEARLSAQALIRFFQSPDTAKSLDDFIQARRREKELNEKIIETLATQVMTIFEREDVEALSKALYKIPKTVEKVGERILLAPQFLVGIDLSKQVTMLEKATAILLGMIEELRRGASIEEVRRQNSELQHIEGAVDKMMTGLLRDLYQMKTDPGRALFLKDLYELLERATDRCRDAGNIIVQIVLKSS